MVDLSGKVTEADRQRLMKFAGQRQAVADRKQQVQDEIKARKVRPVSKSIEGLGKQLDAAFAQIRHTENEILHERKRSQELAVADAEMQVYRKTKNVRN